MEHSGNVESLKDNIILYITGGEFAMPWSDDDDADVLSQEI